MITSIKNADYSFLFEEAGAELLRMDREGLLGERPLNKVEKDMLETYGRFSSLEQYFTRLGDLVAHANNPIKFLMLPLDEPCLEVDANTRTIEIPANFKKYGASVQGDVIAETLFLRIDRYFDAMDLLETDAYVQWKLKDGTEGASKIPYVDYESEHYLGKLILVWPLTGAITAQNGPVQFSLRFLKRKGSDIVYSWNSVPASITIQQALQPKVEYAEFDDASSLFELAIENSKHTSDSDDIEAPSFAAPGYSVGFDNDIIHLNANNAVTLEGQAWVEGQGYLTYDWKYTNLAGSIVESGVKVRGAKSAEFKKTADTTPVANKLYYIEDASATPYGYKEIAHKDFAEITADKYERYATYKITASTSPSDKAEGVVTGTYELIATHKLGFPSADEILSVKIPGPEVLEFVSGDKNEDEIALGLPENGTLLTTDGDLAIEVEVKNDAAPASAYQAMTYTWQKCVTGPDEDKMESVEVHTYDNEDDGHVGETKDALALENATPGWYRVIVDSMLNRDHKAITSNIARVTNAPVAPTLDFPFSADDDNVDVVDAKDFTNRQVELEITHKPFTTTEPIELHSDGLIYEWYEEDALITENTPGFSFDKNKLIINGNAFQKQKKLIECHVSNRLNGAVSAASRSGIFMVSF